MNVAATAKSTQEQAVASWIDYLKQLRLEELWDKLTTQDTNLANALEELRKLKDFVADPKHILGSLKSKHGEIAEHTQVNFSNARSLVEGLKARYSFEGVCRTAPEDYLRDGKPVQSKFYSSPFSTLFGIKIHFNDYPWFIENSDGTYQIPRDQYKRIMDLLKLSPEEALKLGDEEFSLWESVTGFFKKYGINPAKIESSVVSYDDVQLGRIDNTIVNEEKSIKDTDQARRDEAYQQSRPTPRQGAQAAVISAAIEGGMSFCLGVAKKLRSGKKLNEFTAQDWKDVGLDAAIGSGKGAVRGAGVYVLTNFTATPAAVASALVTAVFGVTAQASLLRQGKITAEDFLVNSQVVCLDVTVSAVSSLMGQVLIPIPVLGAIIGNAVGMFMYGIAKDNLLHKEQKLICDFNSHIQRLNKQSDAQYIAIVEQLKHEFAKFESVIELAFDEDVNDAFVGSAALARHLGCSEGEILRNKAAIGAFFLG